MESKDRAKYIEVTDGISKLGPLIHWRLKLRQDLWATFAPKTYLAGLAGGCQAQVHQGQWWQGLGSAVFAARTLPGESR